MKNIVLKTSYMLLVVIIMFGTVACDKQLIDINHDPLAATTVPPDLLFPQVLVNFSSVTRIEFLGLNMHAQQWSGSSGNWLNRSRYLLGIPSVNNGWVGWYTKGIKNLSLVERLVESENPKDLYIIGQSKILKGFIYSNLTQVWGDIPFSEAINPSEFPYPRFDTQEEVLEGIVSLMDEGIALLEQDIDSDIVTGGDLVYNGNKQAWIRWGNSIKLKMLMFLANKKPQEVSAQIQDLVNKPLIISHDQEAKLPYSTAIGNENPTWRFMQRTWNGTPNLWYAGKPLVDLMNALDDPRLATYFDKNNNGVYLGKQQGAAGYANISRINVNTILPDSPDRYSTATETYFLLADAAANGFVSGGLSQANTWFVKGVKLALDYFDGSLGEISQSDKDSYMDSLPDLSTLTVESALDHINDQHYISLFGNGLEAWNLWKRTKSVDFDVPVQGLADDIIRRYSYPESEAGTNSNTPQGLRLDTPMWFEK